MGAQGSPWWLRGVRGDAVPTLHKDPLSWLRKGGGWAAAGFVVTVGRCGVTGGALQWGWLCWHWSASLAMNPSDCAAPIPCSIPSHVIANKSVDPTEQWRLRAVTLHAPRVPGFAISTSECQSVKMREERDGGQDACQHGLGPEGAGGSEPRPCPFSAELIQGNVYVSSGRRRGDEGSGYKLL